MPVNEELDALALLKTAEPFGNGLVFHRGASGGATVSIVARVVGGARAIPLVGPVAVEIGAGAAAARVGDSVLAPQAISGLGVDEAIGVDNGEDVKVVLVQVGVAVRVASEDIVQDVLVDHGGNPFAGVRGAVEDDGGLALAALSVDVQTGDGVALGRAARGDNLRVGRVLGLEILEEGQVVVVAVVRVEPGGVGRASYISWLASSYIIRSIVTDQRRLSGCSPQQ